MPIVCDDAPLSMWSAKFGTYLSFLYHRVNKVNYFTICNQMSISSICQQTSRNTTTRIVGGVEAGVNEFPMMAGLVNLRSRDILCGATISKWDEGEESIKPVQIHNLISAI